MFVTQELRLTGTEEAADEVVVHMLTLMAVFVRRVNRTKVGRIRYGSVVV